MSTTKNHADLSEESQRQLKAWLEDFDRSWSEGRLAARVRKLPPQGHPLRLAALVEMVKIDQRRRWQQGQRVKLEAYLKAYPELGPTETVPVELILAEYELRRQSGSSTGLTDYLGRFPYQAAELRRLLVQPPGGAAEKPRQASRVTRSLSSPAEPTGKHPTPETPAPSGLPALPERLGRYHILERLGEGGMGAVYLAHDDELDRSVALKVPRFGPEDGTEVRERFTREARAAATLSHPNICPVYDVGDWQGVPYVTMAYVEGRPLSDLIQEGKPLPQRPTAAVVRKLALAMHEAHRRGVVHRDLKPSNVMVDRRHEPVVMDFGLACRLDRANERLTRSGTILGTPAYMAPEQVRGESRAIGPPCDVYSLGVILYEMLTGQLPFQGPPAAVLAQVLTQEPARPSALRPDLDPALEVICLKAMARKVEDRYASMADFGQALTQYLKGESGGQPLPEAIPVALPARGIAAAAREAVVVAPEQGTEGLATQLLARLVERLDSPSVSPVIVREAGEGRGGPRGLLVLAACVLLLAVGVVLFLTFGSARGPSPVTVTVQLEGLHRVAADPAVVLILLDGRPVSKEELARPISLETGEHALVLQRGDGSVIEERKFTVSEGATRVNPFEEKAADTPGGKPARPAVEPSAVVKPLIEKLNDEDVKVRRQAAVSLEKLGDVSAVPALVKRVGDDLWHRDDRYDASYSSKKAALNALRALAADEVTPALLGAQRSATMEVRAWACEELGKQKDARAAEGLVAALKDPAEEVRVAAATALPAVRPPAAKALAGALFDNSVKVRRQAAEGLEKLGDRSRLTAEVVKGVAGDAVPALVKRVGDDLWHRDDQHDANYSSKKATLNALRSLGPERVTEALLGAQQSATMEVRAWACEELGKQKDALAAEGLVTALKDPAEEVRVAAAAALPAVRPPPVEALARALFDASVRVRRQAAEGLEKLGDRSKHPAELVRQVAEGAVPALVKRVGDDLWHRDDQHDANYSSKKAALNALRTLAPDRVIEALLGALRSKDLNVRIWACEELGGLKDPASAAGLAEALKDGSEEVRRAAAAALSQPR